MTADDTVLHSALVAEATRKAGLVWLSYAEPGGAEQPRPAWHIWLDDAAYVVCGGLEQRLPGLAEASTATVVVPSKDNGGRVVSWLATVRRIRPEDESWAATTSALAAKRLNAEGGAAIIARWARESTVLRLIPTGEVTESAIDPATHSLAAPPRLTDATTLGKQPRMIGGVRRSRRS